MTSFSMKGRSAKPTSNFERLDYSAFNEYMYGLFDEEEVEYKENRFKKTESCVGILNLIIDGGFQKYKGVYDSKKEAPEYVEEPTDEQKYSDEERAIIEKFPDNNFIWQYDFQAKAQKRKHVRPNVNQRYILAFDFPEIMVDHNEAPYAKEGEDAGTEPLRICYNGKWEKEGKYKPVEGFKREVNFSLDRDGNISDKNILYKLADAMGVLSDFIEDYDVGLLLGKPCKWNVVATRNVGNDGKNYYDFTIKDASAITPIKAKDPITKEKITISPEDQIPECDIKPVGLPMMGGDYSDENLLVVRRQFDNSLQQAIDYEEDGEVLSVAWENTDLCKALKAYRDSSSNNNSSSEENKEESGGTEVDGQTQPDAPITTEDEDDLLKDF